MKKILLILLCLGLVVSSLSVAYDNIPERQNGEQPKKRKFMDMMETDNDQQSEEDPYLSMRDRKRQIKEENNGPLNEQEYGTLKDLIATLTQEQRFVDYQIQNLMNQSAYLNNQLKNEPQGSEKYTLLIQEYAQTFKNKMARTKEIEKLVIKQVLQEKGITFNRYFEAREKYTADFRIEGDIFISQTQYKYERFK